MNRPARESTSGCEQWLAATLAGGSAMADLLRFAHGFEHQLRDLLGRGRTLTGAELEVLPAKGWKSLLPLSPMGSGDQTVEPILMAVDHGVWFAGGQLQCRCAFLSLLGEDTYAATVQVFDQPGMVHV